MSKTLDSDHQEKIPTNQDEMLKGTAVSVSIIGAVMLIFWLIVVYIYVMRF